MKVSLVINVDSRPENPTAETMFSGTVNTDFMTDGIAQKIKFWEGFDLEVIVYVDEHNKVEESVLSSIRSVADLVVVRKHTTEHLFNDWNYIRALQLATGDIVCHCDQDINLYTESKSYPEELISYLDKYSYVSYPSHWSPVAINDSSFNYMWVSTRFFICKRKALNFTEIIKCLTDYEYYVKKYNPSRVCHWLEHFLGIISNSSVFYPPHEPEKGIIFSWGSYEKHTIFTLNNKPYKEVLDFVASRGIRFPNDVFI